MRTPMIVFSLSLLLAGLAPAYDSLNVRLVGRWDSLPDNYSFGVAARGDYACVADFGAGLRVISVADLAHPIEVGYLDTPGHADGVAVSGNIAYVSDGDSGLLVVSVANPAAPTVVGRCATPGYAREVVVVGDFAYVAHDSGLSIISAADPAHPAEVGRYHTPYGAFGVAVAGDYAYVGNSEGLWVVSVSDPSQPTWVGRYITSAMGVGVQGNYVYVAAASAGLRVVSVTDPANPEEVGYLLDPANPAVRLAVSGNYVYVVPGLGPVTYGLRVISVADPANPAEVGRHYLGRNCVALDGGYAYVGAGYSLAILQFYGTGVQEVSSSQATNVRRGTVVRGVLVLGAAGSRQHPAYGADLFDVGGTRVMELHRGANDVSRLSPGVYYITRQSAFGSQHSGAADVLKIVVAR